MKHQNVIFLCAGLLAGLLLGAGLTALLLRDSPADMSAEFSSAPSPAPTELLYTTPAPLVTPSPVPSATPTAAQSAYPDWSKDTVYVGGDKVLHEGKIYRAKWWTQGETPGQADVWEDTKESPTPAASATPAQPPASAQPGSHADGDFKVVGYYPSWKPEGTEKLNYSVLTHVNYAFAIPTADGTLRPLEHEETAKSIIESAHKNGVKVLIAVGGWSYNDVPLEPVFVSATETEAKRAAFAAEIVSLCDRLGFDGVDMDWEHPRVDGASGKQYEAFMLLLAEKLHAKDKLLTSAVLSGATADGNIYYDAAAHSDKVLQAVDWINVMAYDGGDGERHSSYDFAVNCGSYWRDTRGLAADKVVLGVPFYARPSWAAYGDILSTVPDAWKSDNVQYNSMSVWYNGTSTIENKTQYALDNLGGIMIWEVTQDTTDTSKSLLSAIGRTIG